MQMVGASRMQYGAELELLAASLIHHLTVFKETS
ncbi:hypothetical protein HEAR0224 [Herminiimonas arsenicoxydans]|uniref:Uncharacterized protein n=1 Tax=Herminiimonas arsenicoxydans TaxID=204773 RepID=A4G1R6_HERAR|nr:hypothetical protein HEAR0224 [Herminiimonas arsenicoxydans]